ncbi:PREDICTED: polyribonucleotide nucleotidyltransferase 1, mitochondrial [Eufriesea mexicana]|uniref:polyribonucleotide nucleotidyltransferase 1, mitochondrial n=1 Tax=Eufriesea mexicana TaxID=516756 RepID=UPI00083BC1F9|nr:PREDICTED: polyribonucleotide nucleotidyltransferase 1, mitochondrial [Eufriesea mexicana]
MVLFRRNRLLNRKNLALLRLKNCDKNGNIFHVKFMSSDPTEINVQLSNGSKMTLSTGKYARFTSASVTATIDNTTVMTTVVRKSVPSDNSIIPLTVNYRQKAAAIARIPTNFLRREMGYTDNEILISRIIDRSVRPLFDSNYSYETQIVCNLLATDGIINPDVLSINAASTALSISDIPWTGPVAAVRIGLIDDKYIINPTKNELQQSRLNLVLSCIFKKSIVMIEGSADDCLESELRKGIKVGVKECELILNAITQLQKCVGKSKLQIVEDDESMKNMKNFVTDFAKDELIEIFSCHSHDKLSRDNAIFSLRSKILASITNTDPNSVKSAIKVFDELCKITFRTLIFETKKRCDGRKLDDLRDINCDVDLFKPLHGSALFQRGQTQVLCTVALDSIENSLKLDAISMLSSGIKEKHFFLHYEFPPYAVNETGILTGVNRREVGHGALAERGLRAIIPKDYPFAIRLTSDVLESNGSSSMASVCGGSLALMDAGVPILSPVAGVAMGLISRYNDEEKTDIEYEILTDILGIEDHLGDMDFKIAGTKKGFTAFQADMKVSGVPLKVIMKMIEHANIAKSKIIKIMNRTIACPRIRSKSNSPIVEKIEVPVHQRGKFLGIGGSNVKKILYETGVNIHSEDDKMFTIFAPNEVAMKAAKEMIDISLQKDPEPVLTFGDIYSAKITEIRETGVMVILYPTMVPTLLPNSQLDQRNIHHPSVLGLNVGDEIKVKYFGRDPANGRMRLSRKVLQSINSEQNVNFFDKLKQ